MRRVIVDGGDVGLKLSGEMQSQCVEVTHFDGSSWKGPCPKMLKNSLVPVLITARGGQTTYSRQSQGVSQVGYGMSQARIPRKTSVSSGARPTLLAAA